MISKNQNNVWWEFRSLVTPIFSYRAVDINPLMLAPCLSLLLSFSFSFFLPPTPNTLSNAVKPTHYAG
ncbi:MAG: hypothetical protein EBQ87_17515 [Planctomycetes bacterium]|nr:hypothetical protein [Planctomycetota bacterium]